MTEGKGGDCGPGQQPRLFKEYLVPGKWAEDRDAFRSEFQGALREQQGKPPKVEWHEIGSMRGHRIRVVQYSISNGGGSASLILAEGSTGIFSPLMKWFGQMPDPTLTIPSGVSVLVLQKDFGGNVPMVSTWAWVWSERGPVRLDVEAAVQATIEKVAPGHKGYATGLDWEHLTFRTWTWAGPYPGKVGVGETVSGSFTLVGTELAVKEVLFDDGRGTVRRWP